VEPGKVGHPRAPICGVCMSQYSAAEGRTVIARARRQGGAGLDDAALCEVVGTAVTRGR
jgi:hypothetical protein